MYGVLRLKLGLLQYFMFSISPSVVFLTARSFLQNTISHTTYTSVDSGFTRDT
jgi:hypothetical protein